MVVLVFRFAIFGAVKSELAAAYKFKLFIRFAVAALPCIRFFIVPENPVVLDVFHFDQNQRSTQNIEVAYFLLWIHVKAVSVKFVGEGGIGLAAGHQYVDQNIGLGVFGHKPHSDGNVRWELGKRIGAHVVSEFKLDEVFEISD